MHAAGVSQSRCGQPSQRGFQAECRGDDSSQSRGDTPQACALRPFANVRQTLCLWEALECSQFAHDGRLVKWQRMVDALTSEWFVLHTDVTLCWDFLDPVATAFLNHCYSFSLDTWQCLHVYVDGSGGSDTALPAWSFAVFAVNAHLEHQLVGFVARPWCFEPTSCWYLPGDGGSLANEQAAISGLCAGSCKGPCTCGICQ